MLKNLRSSITESRAIGPSCVEELNYIESESDGSSKYIKLILQFLFVFEFYFFNWLSCIYFYLGSHWSSLSHCSSEHNIHGFVNTNYLYSNFVGVVIIY